MIFDKVKNMSKYELLKPVYKFLSKNGILENGKYTVSEDCFVKVFDYDTKSEVIEFENHKNYYDLQMLVTGTELLQTADIDLGVISRDYNSEKDVEFYTAPISSTMILNDSNFVLVAPNELHRSQISVKEQVHAKKYVFKIKY